MSAPSSPGRRVAPRSRRRPDRLVAAGGALVAVAVALALSVGAVGPEPEPDPRASAVPVEAVSIACVGFPARGRSQAFTLSAPLDGAADEGPPGSVAVGPVGGRTEPLVDSAPGVLSSLDVAGDGAAADGSALGVTATGRAAVGRAGFVVDRARDAAAVAVQQCGVPHARWWFTGAAAGLDHRSTLVVANLDPGPAVVDVEVHGPDGLVDSVGTRGITVGAGEVQTLDLVEVAPQTEEIAVHVEASRGRVVAAVADSLAPQPAAAPGREWLPAQTDPSRVLRLAPLPDRADDRTLVLANPSEREALADVEVVGETGTFVPTGVPQLRVPPGSVVTADLTDVLGRESASVVVTSSVRLAGTVRSVRGEDVAYAGVVPLLTGPAAALLPEGSTARLQLSARGEAATAEVVAYDADGEPLEAATLEIDAAATLAWSPPTRAAYLVVTPEDGRVFGGVSTSGAGVSQVPLQPLPVTVRRPVVTPAVG